MFYWFYSGINGNKNTLHLFTISLNGNMKAQDAFYVSMVNMVLNVNYIIHSYFHVLVRHMSRTSVYSTDHV